MKENVHIVCNSQNKLGFTLVELLAVIVILAIISSIAIPIVIDIIVGIKLSSIKTSMNNIEKTLELYYHQNKNGENIIFECNKGTCKDNIGKKLEVKGNLPESGKIIIAKSGKIIYESIIIDGYLCDKYADEFVCNQQKGKIIENNGESIVIEDKQITQINNYKIYGNSILEDSNIISVGDTILPEEYQEVEFIESTGTQYIDTKDYQNGDTIEIIANAKGMFINCLTGLTTGRNFTIQFNNLNNFSIYGNVVIDNSEIIGDYIKINATITGSGKYGRIFAYYNTTINGATGKLVSFIHKRNNELYEKFIPCYRKSDNEIGVYDLVNNVFYPNQGIGTFNSGKDKKIYIIPVKVSNGTETIITNINLQEPLRKIENYVDYIDYSNKKLIRNVGVIKLTGEENFKINSGVFTLKLDNYPKLDEKLSISNYLEYGKSFWFEKDKLNIKIEGIHTIEELKVWFSNNKVEINYPLSKSIISEIEIPKININSNYSNILIDTKAIPSKVLLEYN